MVSSPGPELTGAGDFNHLTLPMKSRVCWRQASAVAVSTVSVTTCIARSMKMLISLLAQALFAGDKCVQAFNLVDANFNQLSEGAIDLKWRTQAVIAKRVQNIVRSDRLACFLQSRRPVFRFLTIHVEHDEGGRLLCQMPIRAVN